LYAVSGNGFQNIFADNQYQAESQMQAIDAKYKVATGSSNCCPLTVGQTIETTAEHPFYKSENRKDAADLQTGDIFNRVNQRRLNLHK